MRDVVIQREIGSIVREDLSFGYEQLNALAQVLKIDKSQFTSETDYINELFRQGLYVVTIQEPKRTHTNIVILFELCNKNTL